ncbi:SPOSA6832_01201, partial [Sporobolomyces salmonicolor]
MSPPSHVNDPDLPGHQRKSHSAHAHKVPGVVAPGSTGVMYVSERAGKNGWSAGDPEGQGAPEVGHIPGSSPRPDLINIAELSASAGADVNEYAPTTGVKALREAVAAYYNATYRQGKPSQYTADNVCIVPGGVPEYTAYVETSSLRSSSLIQGRNSYDQLLSSFRRLVPIPTTLYKEDAYHLNVSTLEQNIKDMGLSAVMLSNPHNPTGQVIHGEELKRLVDIARKGTTMILDEFYEQYVYDLGEGAQVSAAEFIEDVNEDNVILINGLTKCWRLPGWRVCWVVGPKSLTDALGQSGGFLDGGASHLLQVAAIPLLSPSHVHSDRLALQRHFRQKRDHVVERLRAMGFPVSNAPTSTFYIWLDLEALPKPLSSGMVFFEECLKEKVIVVPGQFFDLNPSHRRNLLDAPCNRFVRLSFGPPLGELDRGLDGIQRLVEKARKHEKEGKNLREIFGKDLKQ